MTTDRLELATRWEFDRTLRIGAWTAACVAASCQFLYVADSGLVSMALPLIEQDHPAVARSVIAWVAAGFLVAQSSLLLVGGWLGDRYGRRRFFLLGMSLFTLGAFATAAAPTIGLIIAARVLQGIGAAFLTSGALALVMPMFPPHRTPALVGLWGAVGSIGAWLTPTAGTLLVERSWRYGFVLIAVVGAAAVLFGRKFLVETVERNETASVDRFSLMIGPPALGLFMLVLSRGPRWGWTSPLTLALGLVATLMLAGFVWRSNVATEPLLDLDILRNRGFSAYIGAGALQQLGFYAWYLTAPIVMHQVWGWSVREVGFGLALSQVLAFIGAPLGGRLVTRHGNTFPAMLGAAGVAAAEAWHVATVSDAPRFWWSFAPAALLFGFGSGMCGTVTSGAGLTSLPSRLLGSGNSVQQLIRRTGSSLGVALGIGLLGDTTGAALLDGARRVWIFVAIVHLAMAIPLWIARSEEPDRHRVIPVELPSSS